MSDDPGQGALDEPAAGQHLEGVRVALADDLQLDLQAGGPGGELAGVQQLANTAKTASQIDVGGGQNAVAAMLGRGE